MAITVASSAEWKPADNGCAEAKAVHELTGRDVCLERWYTSPSATVPRLVTSNQYHVKRVRTTRKGGTPYLVFDTTNDEEIWLLEHEASGHPEFTFVSGPVGERAMHFRVSCAGTAVTSVTIMG